MDKKIILHHQDAEVEIVELSEGLREVSVHKNNPKSFVSIGRIITSYPVDLIKEIVGIHSPSHVCEVIRRGEDANYLQALIESVIFSHVDKKDLEGKRILDFGCGIGSSTVILSKLLPGSQLVGLDINGNAIRVAKSLAEHHKCKNVDFIVSDGPSHVSDSIGAFDHVMLCAAYEHLLPQERVTILSGIWQLLKAEGMLFITDTPHRYYPIEFHTTGLPFVNYMPRNIALRWSRAFSDRVRKDADWTSLLRCGIRGGTVREIIGILEKDLDHYPEIVPPILSGEKDEIGLWIMRSGSRYKAALKKIVSPVLRIIRRITGETVFGLISIAIKKMER